jgi:hypothetical protein
MRDIGRGYRGKIEQGKKKRVEREKEEKEIRNIKG